MEKLLRPGEVAEILALSRSSVYKLADTGELPAIRLGGSLRFSPTMLERWLEERAAGQERAV